MRQALKTLNSEPGWVFWRNNVGVDTVKGVRYGLCVGSADLIGCADGRFVAVECKAPGGRASVAQRKFGRLVIDRGGIAVLHYGAGDLVDKIRLAINNEANRKYIGAW